MKRYLLFGGDMYYARGGMCDFLGVFDSVADAVAKANEMSEDGTCEEYEWWHVLDLESGTVVASEWMAHGGDGDILGKVFWGGGE